MQSLHDVLHAVKGTSSYRGGSFLAPQIPVCTYVNCYSYINILNLQSQAKNAFLSCPDALLSLIMCLANQHFMFSINRSRINCSLNRRLPRANADRKRGKKQKEANLLFREGPGVTCWRWFDKQGLGAAKKRFLRNTSITSAFCIVEFVERTVTGEICAGKLGNDCCQR